MALGELNLSVEEFGNMTMKEIKILSDAYLRRRYNLEDLFICWSALPVFQMHLGKKSPSFKKLTAYRDHNKFVPTIEESKVEQYKTIIEEGESLVEKSRNSQ